MQLSPTETTLNRNWRYRCVFLGFLSNNAETLEERLASLSNNCVSIPDLISVVRDVDFHCDLVERERYNETMSRKSLTVRNLSSSSWEPARSSVWVKMLEIGYAADFPKTRGCLLECRLINSALSNIADHSVALKYNTANREIWYLIIGRIRFSSFGIISV